MKGTHQIAVLLLAPLFMLATSCHHDNLPPRLTQQQITDYCKALSGEYEGAYHILYYCCPLKLKHISNTYPQCR